MNRNRQLVKSAVIIPLIVLAVILLFFTCVRGIDAHARSEGTEQLENAVRKAALTCYAVEGEYPQSLAYLEEHYGLNINRDRYAVYYERRAGNLMPEITVLERMQ